MGVDAIDRHDYATALRELKPRAEQGEAVAQLFLGTAYYTGEGVNSNDVLAYCWCTLAIAQGEEDAQKFKDDLAGFMTPEQIAEAEKMIVDWKPKSE